MTNNLVHMIETEDNSNWPIIVDGFFKLQVEKQMLDDEITQESVDSIFDNAVRVLSKCPNPILDNDISETGILIGKVQSGKTSNFISLLSLAFDNGYDIAIILGGNTLQLLKQNAQRVTKAFNVSSDKLTVLKTNDHKSLINPERIKEFIENERKIIIVGLKHYKHINQIAEIFSNQFIANKSVIIIDDEGDQATLNTKAFLDSMSSTYESVVNLKSKIRSHCFLSITATPQANILIKVFDNLSPDFGELVYPGVGYCGLNEFHGEDRDKYIYEIPLNESNLIDGDGVPLSLYKAMAMFFVGNAIRRKRNDHRNHAMLIHPSQKKFDHKLVVSKIQSILDSWKSIAKIKLTNGEDLSYSSLKTHLIYGYNAFSTSCINLPEFKELELEILNIIKHCSPVHICNSDQNASENSNLYSTNIFVGGNLVERGITIKGLAVTYITRRAKGKSNVDNTEQRARWFGYKSDYLDVCRVFTTKDIKDDFISILDHDEDMWATIERAKERGLDFKEMPRIFKLQRSAFLSLTRKNVAKAEQYILSEWKPQKFFELNESKSLFNDSMIVSFRTANLNQLKTIEHNKTQVHSYIYDLSFSELFVDLLSKLNYPDNELLDKEYFSMLNEALKKFSVNPKIDIVWIRDVSHSMRKIEQNGEIQQLFQGRNPNKASLTYYEGDRSLANHRPNNMQLQIHYIKPNNLTQIDFYSPVLALYVPEWCANKLSELVVGYNV